MKKASKRFVYVLSPDTSTTGHSLGVNSLAVNPRDKVLFSAGRDGLIHSWNLDPSLDVASDADYGDDLSDGAASSAPAAGTPSPTTPGQRAQIHTNWVNDIVLTNNYQSVASCSSDLTVKLWSPSTGAQELVGQHRDYVKCLASPSPQDNWIVSGGLDRRIIGWDLGDKIGSKFEIVVDTEDPKSSVYALAVSKHSRGGSSAGSLVATGGPESIVRLYDTRAPSKQVVNFVGHTDNIRALLMSDDGEWVLSGSSDSTIKLWSVSASRLLHTFDMHDDSVWSLFSNNSNLDVFYSSDRSGLVTKTDLRGAASKMDAVDDGVCTAVCNEHQGVAKVVASGSYLWTATSNSWIHRWQNVDTRPYSNWIAHHREDPDHGQSNEHRSEVSFLRMVGGPSLDFVGTPVEPKKKDDDEDNKEEQKNKDNKVNGSVNGTTNGSANGSYGSLAPSSNGEVHVVPFHKNPLETLEGHIGIIKHRLLTDRLRVLALDTSGEVALWDLIKCVPIQSFGSGVDIDELADQLNGLEGNGATIANWCTVATRTGEIYVSLESSTCFDAEVYADELTPESLNNQTIEFREDQRINVGKWVIRNLLARYLDAELARDHDYRAAHAAPGTEIDDIIQTHPDSMHNKSLGSKDNDNNNDSRSSTKGSSGSESISSMAVPQQQAAQAQDNNNNDNTKDAKESKGKFMGKLRGLGKSKKDKGAPTPKPASSTPSTTTPSSAVPTKPSTPRPEMTVPSLVEDLQSRNKTLQSPSFFPPPTDEAPPLPIPEGTKVMISEQSPDSGGTVDLYRGTVGSTGKEIEEFRSIAPEWIGRILLCNEVPTKEGAKVGFTLQPYSDGQPALAGGETLRLTAYQMLRARKVRVYLVDKLEKSSEYQPEQFELLCQDRPIAPHMTLATIRTKIWRSGGDVVIKYRLASQ